MKDERYRRDTILLNSSPSHVDTCVSGNGIYDLKDTCCPSKVEKARMKLVRCSWTIPRDLVECVIDPE